MVFGAVKAERGWGPADVTCCALCQVKHYSFSDGCFSAFQAGGLPTGERQIHACKSYTLKYTYYVQLDPIDY